MFAIVRDVYEKQYADGIVRPTLLPKGGSMQSNTSTFGYLAEFSLTHLGGSKETHNGSLLFSSPPESVGPIPLIRMFHKIAGFLIRVFKLLGGVFLIAFLIKCVSS
jgi:hypothetical protein